MMSKKERFLTAIRREIPDMVPVSPLIHNRFAYATLGKTGWRAVFKIHQMIGSIYFRGPTGIKWRVRWPEGWSEVSRSWREAHRIITDHLIRTPFGLLKERAISGFNPRDPLVSKTVEFLVKSERDYELYKAYLEVWLRRAEPDFKEISEAYRVMGDQGIAQVSMNAAFTDLVSVRGVKQTYIDLYLRPGVVEEVLKVLWEIKEKEIEAFLDSPSEVLYYDLWGAFGLGPDHFRRFVLPELKRAVKLVKGVEGKYIGFYMVGRIKKQLPLVIQYACPDFIEPFELQSDITLRDAKSLYGDRICIMGNFDPVLLAFGTYEDCVRETLRCLSEGMSNGGYVLVTGDEVPANAKLDNLKAIVRTAEKYGRY